MIIITLANCSCLLTVLAGSWQLLSGLLRALEDIYTWLSVKSLLGAYILPRLLGTSRPLGPPGPLGLSGPSGPSVQLV